MKKLFRFHRGSLADSLATTIEVTGLAELRKRIEADFPQGYLRNIRIKNRLIRDLRLPEEWGGTSYYVVADFDGYEGSCIGMSNFYEELKLAYTNPTGSCGTQVSMDNKITMWDKRTKEEREAERRKKFLKELSELLRKYDAVIESHTCGGDDSWIDITIGGTQEQLLYDTTLTADNMFDYD